MAGTGMGNVRLCLRGRMPGDRERVRTLATTGALQLARLAITGAWWRTD